MKLGAISWNGSCPQHSLLNGPLPSLVPVTNGNSPGRERSEHLRELREGVKIQNISGLQAPQINKYSTVTRDFAGLRREWARTWHLLQSCAAEDIGTRAWLQAPFQVTFQLRHPNCRPGPSRRTQPLTEPPPLTETPVEISAL